MQSPQPLAQTALLPSPTLTLTIPSHKDGTLLSCRVYHPVTSPSDDHAASPSEDHAASPSEDHAASPPSLRKRAAILAHPYAPLGGCQDDPVLDAVGSLLLESGFVVGTLDFRGAGTSQGRTSWTGKPEAEDLASFAGFMAYYMHFLTGDGGPEGPADAHQEKQCQQEPLLLFMGYSMGALVTSHTPPLRDILLAFETPGADSHTAQLRLRAEALAAQHNIFAAKLREERARRGEPASPSRNVRVGGDEGSRANPRKSHDGKHRRIPSMHETEEKLRRRVNSLIHRPAPQKLPSAPPANGCLPRVAGFVTPSSAFVLVSRPHGLLAHLLTLTVLPTALASRRRTPEESAAERKLVENPTLMVYGSADGMFPVGKSRAIAQRLESMEMTDTSREKMFRSREVEGAGHFWLEEGVLQELMESIAEFASDLLMEKSGS